MQYGLYRILIDRSLEEKQKVNVRLRMDGRASISSDRHECKQLGTLAITPHVANDFVQLVANDCFDADARRVGQESRFQVVYKGFQLGSSRRLHRRTS